MSRRYNPESKLLARGIVILHEDRDIIVVDKPPGLLTVSTDREKSQTTHSYLTDYIRQGCAKSRKRIFVVHRLDRETSGVLIFAKSEDIKDRLQSQWNETKKKYLAVVHGTCKNSSATISTHLTENKAYFVYSTTEPGKGKLAHTSYKVLKQTKVYALLEVDLLTGRKNQIRVHLAEIGHPIVGDHKYGREDRSHPRLALHAKSISFKHPTSGKQLSFSTKVPGYFKGLVGIIDQDDSQPAENTAESIE